MGCRPLAIELFNSPLKIKSNYCQVISKIQDKNCLLLTMVYLYKQMSNCLLMISRELKFRIDLTSPQCMDLLRTHFILFHLYRAIMVSQLATKDLILSYKHHELKILRKFSNHY